MSPKKRGPGRPREYGDEAAIKISFSCPVDLWESLLAKWKRSGSKNRSRMIQAALRLWMSQQAGAKTRELVRLQREEKATAKHTHVTLKPDLHAALQLFGDNQGRSIPDLIREAIARFIRDHGDAPEFANLDEWILIEDPDIS